MGLVESPGLFFSGLLIAFFLPFFSSLHCDCGFILLLFVEAFLAVALALYYTLSFSFHYFSDLRAPLPW